MKFKTCLHSFDNFGATVSLNFKKQESYRTSAGGLASIFLRVVVLIFFIMQLIAVVEHEDPTITSYEILEDRSKMTVSDFVNAGDLKLNF